MNFGQGGRANPYPSRAYGRETIQPDRFVGGQRGPAALPARLLSSVRAALPALLGGAFGPISYHRGAMVEDAGAPRIDLANDLWHSSIAWSRPIIPNTSGEGYVPPTVPSWLNLGVDYVAAPAAAIPYSSRKRTWATVNEEFGPTRIRFPWPGENLAPARIQRGRQVQYPRWRAQAKTANPWAVLLSTWGQAPSYGSSTTALATAPIPIGAANASGMGAY